MQALHPRLELAEGAPRVGQQHLAGARGKRPLADALEERQPEPPLELRHLHADGGLGQVELAGGPRERAVAGDDLQGAQRAQAQLHGRQD